MCTYRCDVEVTCGHGNPTEITQSGIAGGNY